MPERCPNGTFSSEGAQNQSECTACDEGYYCLQGSTQKLDCPIGHYCTNGTELPEPCPKGTFGGKTNLKSDSECSLCPSGSLCNITGISDPSDYLCPPGYYCERGALTPTACPSGTYLPTRGGTSFSKCISCEAGYYCANTATVIPILCKNGTYCYMGSSSSTQCPPGSYCPARSAKPLICPDGFYCPGRSEYYYKCMNGTFCPPGSSSPIICPGGSYGSGIALNSNLKVSCSSCGRGLYAI